MKLNTRRLYHDIWLFILITCISVFAACNALVKTKPPSKDEPPTTTIANVPVNGDTLFALVTLHWDGGDNDGFVQSYQYRYTTEDMNTGDTTSTSWQDTKETSLTISFNSPHKLNKQTFEVRAVDNKGVASKTPAKKIFYTKQTHPPKVQIATPQNNHEYFYMSSTSDWYQGIHLTYSGSDADGSIVQYGWAVDNGDWHWTSDTTVYITPQEFESSGKHIVRLIGKDNTDLLSVNPDTVHIDLIKPKFDKKILIIDETKESAFPNNVNATDKDVDQFYSDIFGTQNQWDFQAKGMPPRDVIGQYKLIIWHADNPYSQASDAHKLGQHTAEIEDYLNVGGNFVMSGWRILNSFAPGAPFPRTFKPGTFVHDYLHIAEANESPVTVPGDFAGAYGIGNFHDAAVDTNKLNNSFPYEGYLSQINTIPKRGAFTKIIYSYHAKPNSQLPDFRGQTVGIQYFGTSFNAVVLGFPIYFLKKQDAQVVANDILNNMGFK